jgi:phage baseplate assembly protein W
MATYYSSGSSGSSQAYSGQSTGAGATSAIGGTNATVKERYTDLNLQMIPHPQKRDIIPLKGSAAVKNAIRNLLLTSFHERPFNSTLGANLRGLLFEPADAVTKISLKNNVKRVLEDHEPRIDNINVIVNPHQNDTEYRITVVFSIKATDEVSDVEINLRRLR